MNDRFKKTVLLVCTAAMGAKQTSTRQSSCACFHPWPTLGEAVPESTAWSEVEIC
jgi:hypothetical protein